MMTYRDGGEMRCDDPNQTNASFFGIHKQRFELGGEKECDRNIYNTKRNRPTPTGLELWTQKRLNQTRCRCVDSVRFDRRGSCGDRSVLLLINTERVESVRHQRSYKY